MWLLEHFIVNRKRFILIPIPFSATNQILNETFSFFLQIGIVCRPVALSIPYLIFLFYTPFVPLATSKTIRAHTGYYFKLVIAITSIVVLLQIAFQLVLVFEGSDFLKSCEFLEILFRHIGMIKLNNIT